MLVEPSGQSEAELLLAQAHLARGELDAGLYGRDRQGNALMMGYADARQERYTVSRLSLVPSTGK